MNSIEWKSQDQKFGLDYSTKTGKWEDYRFDIRYDYDGDPLIKPENCILNLTIFKGSAILHRASSYKVDLLIFESNLYMQDEQRKFLKANFE
jgi:hypothetical protein